MLNAPECTDFSSTYDALESSNPTHKRVATRIADELSNVSYLLELSEIT